MSFDAFLVPLNSPQSINRIKNKNNSYSSFLFLQILLKENLSDDIIFMTMPFVSSNYPTFAIASGFNCIIITLNVANVQMNERKNSLSRVTTLFSVGFILGK